LHLYLLIQHFLVEYAIETLFLVTWTIYHGHEC